MERAEDPQEDLLRKIERFFAVAQQMGSQPQHQAMVLEHQRRVGGLVAREAPFDERGFAAGDL